MSYIDQSLGDGETIIARARFHWLYNLYAWGSLLLPLLVHECCDGATSDTPRMQP